MKRVQKFTVLVLVTFVIMILTVRVQAVVEGLLWFIIPVYVGTRVWMSLADRFLLKVKPVLKEDEYIDAPYGQLPIGESGGDEENRFVVVAFPIFIGWVAVFVAALLLDIPLLTWTVGE